MQLLQQAIVTFLVLYLITFAIKVAQHLYLYVSSYKDVKWLLREYTGESAGTILMLMAYLYCVDVFILFLVHPRGLRIHGVQWVLRPISGAGTPLGATSIANTIVKIID
jgi:hypothetical protein